MVLSSCPSISSSPLAAITLPRRPIAELLIKSAADSSKDTDATTHSAAGLRLMDLPTGDFIHVAVAFIISLHSHSHTHTHPFRCPRPSTSLAGWLALVSLSSYPVRAIAPGIWHAMAPSRDDPNLSRPTTCRGGCCDQIT